MDYEEGLLVVCSILDLCFFSRALFPFLLASGGGWEEPTLLEEPAKLGKNKYDTTTCMRPASLHSYKQRFIYEDLSGDDSKLLLYRITSKTLART